MAWPAHNSAQASGIQPVWRRISLQMALLSLIAGALVLAAELSLPQPEASLSRLLAIGMAALPALLWLAISVAPEYRSDRPRRRLLAVAIVSALVANAIGAPLVESFFAVGRWLPLESVFSRIIGYTFCAGMVAVGLNFLVLRYLVYPRHLRVRSDAVAYAFAAAIGYSFALNLAELWQIDASWDAAAMHALASLSIQLAASLFIALGLIESYFGDALPLTLPLHLLVAAAASGSIAALHPGLLSGSLSQAGSADRPFFGLAFLVAAWCLALGISRLLYSASLRREREAFASRSERDAI